MTYPRFLAQLLLFILLLSACARAQKTNALPRSTPEAEGVASGDIIKFLDAAATSKTEFHSFMLLEIGNRVITIDGKTIFKIELLFSKSRRILGMKLQ